MFMYDSYRQYRWLGLVKTYQGILKEILELHKRGGPGEDRAPVRETKTHCRFMEQILMAFLNSFSFKHIK